MQEIHEISKRVVTLCQEAIDLKERWQPDMMELGMLQLRMVVLPSNIDKDALMKLEFQISTLLQYATFLREYMDGGFR